MILPSGYSDDARALWEAATALNRAAAAVSPSAARLPSLLFFTDPERTPAPWEIAARLPTGAAVVYRAFGRPDALEIGRRLREATTSAGVALLIGRDVDLAEALAADGLHLPEREAERGPDIRARHPDWRLTAAWHGDGPAPSRVDALVLSPVFPAGGASAARPSLGVEAFQRHVRACPLPIYALGGVTVERTSRLIGSGACGLAGVEAIQSAFAEAPIRI